MSEYALDRHCDKHGCAKLALDPKLHTFDSCFERGIRFGDVDGAVERNGHILWLEWKCGADLDSFEETHVAQIIQAKAFTRNSDKQVFIFVIGDPVAMSPRYHRTIRGGQWKTDWTETNIEKLSRKLRAWYLMADGA